MRMSSGALCIGVLLLLTMIACSRCCGQHGGVMLNPTAVSVQSGDWCNPDTWGGTIPGDNDVVIINAGHAVALCDANASILDIGVHGELFISDDHMIRCRTLQVYHGGFLNIVDSGHIEFRDIAPDDPEELGLGLVIMGRAEVIGRDKLPWARATHDIFLGDDQITLDQDVAGCNGAGGWNVGDRVVIGNSTQRPQDHIKRLIATQNEPWSMNHEAVITAVDGTTITIDPPMTHDAKGCVDNPFGVKKYTVLANLTRSITIKSQNPSGHRGHCMSMDGSHTIFRNVLYEGLGRTRADVRISETNVVGRYAEHCHRAVNPATVYERTGCSFNDWGKWGLSLHEVADAVVDYNCFVNGIGSAIVTERGNEVRNRITRNCIIGAVGTLFQRGGLTLLPREVNHLVDGKADFALDGSGIWCRRVGNIITDNVMCGLSGYGLNMNGYYSQAGGGGGPPDLVWLDENGDQQSGTSPGTMEVARNEVFGSWGGLWFTYSQGGIDRVLHLNPEQVITDTTCWNLTAYAYESFHDGNITIDGLINIGDPAVAALNDGAGRNAWARRSITFKHGTNYPNFSMEYRRVRSFATNVGIETVKNYNPRLDPGPDPTNPWGEVTLIDCEFHCYTGIYVHGGRNSAGSLLGLNYGLDTTFILNDAYGAESEPLDNAGLVFDQLNPQGVDQ